MHGLRIVPVFRYPRELLTEAERAIEPSPVLKNRDGSDFALYFGSVLPLLEHLVWFADEYAFVFPLEWSGDDEENASGASLSQGDQRRAWIALEGDGRTMVTVDPNWILQPGFVGTYARYVNDDWNSLYGFTRAPDDWREWMRRRFEGGQAERAAFLKSTVDVCFLSIDGAYWEFHARDPLLVERVRGSLKGLDGLRLEDVLLEASAGI